MQDKRDFNITNGSKGKTQELIKKKSRLGHGCLCCVVQRRLWTVRDTKGRKRTNTEQKWIKGENPGISKKETGSVHVGFVVDKVALGQVFPRVLRFSSVNFIPPVLH
jgi:hypothetical protein